MIELAILGLPALRLVDVFDIAIVAILAYTIYRMARGTNVMIIFWALIILLLAWRVADTLGMRLLGAILSAVASVGLIALVVIFQPEIRKFCSSGAASSRARAPRHTRPMSTPACTWRRARPAP